MQWDVFCRVVDNFGDIGVCWRLCADLARRGEQLRLWVDDASALAWMAPAGAAGVTVRGWPEGEDVVPVLGDVVVAAFGCALPAPVLAAMAQRRPAPPVWLNLEYLSAEAYVERSHGLPSLQQTGPGAGLTQWFFYPGFTRATGGLLREADLMARRQAFDPVAWLDAMGVRRRPGERIVSLFCYDGQPALAGLLARLGEQPTLVLATAGPAACQVRRLLGDRPAGGKLRAVALPLLTQTDYDHLLWASDLNFVRGEDSWVRAQWAGRPFVWQAYAQPDTAHAAKLEAFMDRFLAAAPGSLAGALRRLWRHWNGLGDPASPFPPLPDLPPWQAHCLAWCEGLEVQADLASQLLGFVAARRG